MACLKAGINQFLDTYIDELTTAEVKDGSVTEAEIDELLRPKFRASTVRLGLLESAGDGALFEDQGLAGPWRTQRKELRPSRRRWRWNRWCF